MLWLLVALGGCLVPSEDIQARLDRDGDGLPWPDDCDPDDPGVTRPSWYADVDRDGHGDPIGGVVGCEPPPGFVAVADDCDDAEPLSYPGGAELCDGIDNDCDGATTDTNQAS